MKEQEIPVADYTDHSSIAKGLHFELEQDKASTTTNLNTDNNNNAKNAQPNAPNKSPNSNNNNNTSNTSQPNAANKSS